MFAHCLALFYIFSVSAGCLGGILGHIYFLDVRNLHWAFTKMHTQIINQMLGCFYEICYRNACVHSADFSV